jgi:FkbH-like protein
MNPETLSTDDLLLKRKALRRQLSVEANLQPVRIFVLGGSTANEVVEILEVLLLASGFKPEIRQSEYGRFYEDAVQDATDLIAFAPDIVYLHTSVLNLQQLPPTNASESELQAALEQELSRYRQIWQSIRQKVSSQMIQNNFELPPFAILGNMDSVSSGGATRFVLEMNAAFGRAAGEDSRLILHDIHSLSSRIGLNQWFDWVRYFSYKIAITSHASVAMARSLTAIVRAIYSRSRKVLVLDLDNTLWGGVIGDDGVDRIQIGKETAVAEAYTAFQQYCLSLQRRGILLAVCSKNDEGIVRHAFEHPDSVLKLEHFASFKANWEPKHENILAIAQELNLVVDSFVFVDDNPAERALVAAQIPGIAVPDIGSDVTRFAQIIEEGRYFESVTMSQEDISRAALYQANAMLSQVEAKFANYGDYLDSLEMIAEIGIFRPIYLERIVQLINKTNQFNLTTRRYTFAQIEAIYKDSAYIGLCGRLRDRFGDNGLVSIILGRRDGQVLHLDLWLMSCRVLKRDMESAMLDSLVDQAAEVGIQTLVGYFIPTRKNAMVEEHYEKLGFEHCLSDVEDGASTWMLKVSDYQNRNQHIRVSKIAHA